jgi:CSLREA domain-containing protein
MALLVAASLFGIVGGARATTYTVNSPADVPDADPQTAACETASGNGVCTLRAAVQQANAHAGADIILVPANTYLLSRVGHEYEALNGDLDVTDDVTIIGSGAGLTIIDGNSAVTGDRVFHLIGSYENKIKVNLVNMTIQHGVGIYGGGVSISGAQTQIDGCVITANSAASSMHVPGGGGIDNAGSLVLTNSVVSDNTNEDATALGGGIHSYGPLTIRYSTDQRQHIRRRGRRSVRGDRRRRRDHEQHVQRKPRDGGRWDLHDRSDDDADQRHDLGQLEQLQRRRNLRRDRHRRALQHDDRGELWRTPTRTAAAAAPASSTTPLQV